MPAIYHVKVVDDSFDGAVQHIIEAKPNDAVVWHCEEADANFDGAIFHVKWAAANFDGPVWRVLGIARAITVVLKGTSPLTLPDAIADSLSYVKAFGGTEQRNLPDGYTQLEYIESSGTQYIDIDVSGDATFIGTAQSTTDSSTTSQVLVANSGASAGHWFGVQSPGAGSSFAKRWGLGATATASSTIDGTTKVDFEITFTQSSQYGTVNDQVLNRESSTSAHTNWIVFAGNTTPSYGFIGKVWGLKVVQNDVLVRNLIPAKNSSNVIGMYDIVNDVFYENAGTGTFAAGGEVVPTPDAPMDIVSNNGVLKARHQSGLLLRYQQVEWISSDAKIIITGFKTKNTQTFKAKFIKASANSQYLYASDSSSSGTTNTTAYISASDDSGGNWRFGGGAISFTTSTNVMYETTQNKNGMWVNGSQVGTYSNVGSFTSTSDLGALSSSSATPLRLYYLQVEENGIKVLDLVPVKDLVDNTYGLYNLVDGQFYTNTDATITAGDPVSDPVEIYADGTVETINVHGKNLFNSTPYKTGYYIDANGNEVEASQYQEEYLIRQARVQPSTQYTISLKGVVGGYTQRIHAYDAAGNWLSQVAAISTITPGVVSSASFTTPANCAYIRQGGRSQTEYQLERGSTATTYEPYYNGGTATAEMLLKVGDYQDVQSILDGVVTRNVGVKVLDGTENWSVNSTSNAPFRVTISDMESSNTIGLNNIFGICSHFQAVANTASWVNYNNMVSVIESSRNVCFRYLSGISNVNTFKQYLADQYAAGTPVIIVYPLATETTESVTGQTLQVQAGDNTLEITQASMTGLELEAQYQAAVSLTIQEVQDANLDPNVEVTIN